MNMIQRTESRIRGFLSHRPRLYAFIAGIGIVLFWRGAWNSVDTIRLLISHYSAYSTIDHASTVWWDGPVSLALGTIILYFIGAFVSSFIGNELILSGLRGEKRLNEKSKTEMKTEINAIAEMRDELTTMARKLEALEMQRINQK